MNNEHGLWRLDACPQNSSLIDGHIQKNLQIKPANTTKQNLVDTSNFHIDTEQEVIAASLHLLTKSDMLNVQETH